MDPFNYIMSEKGYRRKTENSYKIRNDFFSIYVCEQITNKAHLFDNRNRKRLAGGFDKRKGGEDGDIE